MGPCEGLFLPLIEDYLGQRDSLSRQSAMPLMGQCEPIIQTLCVCNGPTQGFVPPADIILCGLCDSPVRQSSMPLMGQRDPTAQMLCARKGPTRGVVHPANRILYGPARLSRARVTDVMLLIGQCELIV